MRKRAGSFNEAIADPAIIALLPETRGLSFLELGTGTGALACEIARRGARVVIAIDRSPELMLRATRSCRGLPVRFKIGDVETMRFGFEKFDVVVSSLCFHFIARLGVLLRKIHDALRPGGTLIFAIRHPMRTAFPDGGRAGANQWIVRNYVRSGRRTHVWLGHRIQIYHRSLTTLFRLVRAARFQVFELVEPVATRSLSARFPALREASHCPPFLVFRCVKPKEPPSYSD